MFDFLRFLKYASLFACVIIIGTSTGFSNELQNIQQHMRDAGLKIDQQVETAYFNQKAGIADHAEFERQAKNALISFETLEFRVRQLPEEHVNALTPKLESIRSQVENLLLAVKLNDGAPPLPARSHDAVVTVNQNHTNEFRAPGNDACDSPYLVGFGTYAGETSTATNDGEASCGSSLYSPDVWFSLSIAETANIWIDTIGSSYDTVLSAHNGCPGTINNQTQCNDDTVGLHAGLSFTAYSGHTYLIRLSGVDGAAGPYTLNITTAGVIEGTVVNELTGQSISTYAKVYDSDGYQIGSDSTDSNGLYSIGGLLTDSYFVATDSYSSANVDELYNNHPCPYGPPDGCDVTNGDTVAVVLGEITEEIDFSLDQSGTISGTVTNNQNVDPVSSARVNIYNESGTYVGYRYSNSNGEYESYGLPTGQYFLVAEHSSFVDEAYDDVLCPGGFSYGCDISDATAVVVTTNSTVDNIDFTLQPLGAISGIVVDRQTGDPLSIPVYIYNAQGYYLKSANSDPSTGLFNIGGLDDGTYFAAARPGSSHIAQVFNMLDCPSSGCVPTQGTPINITNHNTVDDVGFSLLKKGSMTGTVVDELTQTPLSSIQVRIYNVLGYSVNSDYTDTLGNFWIDGLETDIYFARTESSSYENELYNGLSCENGCLPASGTAISVIQGSTTSGIDFSIIKKGSISGTVQDATTGATVQMRIKLYNSDGSYIASDTSYSGVYDFLGLSAGWYYVVAEHYSLSQYLEELYDALPCWGGAPSGCSVTMGTPVLVSPNITTSGIDFRLQKAGSISGSVVDETSHQLLSGRVYAINIETGSTHTDSHSGAYLITGLSPGNHIVVSDVNSHVDEIWEDLQCTGEYPDDCDVSGGSPVQLGIGTTVTGLDFEHARLASLSGYVRDALTSTPLNSFTVRCYDDRGYNVRSTSSTTDGSFEIGSLWPGTYFLATAENRSSHVDQLFDGIECHAGPPNGCNPLAGQPLVVDIGSLITGIDFALLPTGTIEGRVTDDSTGDALSGIYVSVWDSGGNSYTSVSTDSNGLYRAYGIASGTFFVSARDSSYYSNYIDELYNDIPCWNGPPAGCDPTKGTGIAVTAGTTVRFIDFALSSHFSGITGQVKDLETNQPLAGARVDFWDASTGTFTLSSTTTSAGTYVAHLDPGSYFCATDNSVGRVNQIWNEVACFGSPFNGDCDVTQGDPVTVSDSEMTQNINFDLHILYLFADGFERGDSSGWSTSYP